MSQEATFGSIVKERRYLLGLTQAELGRRVGCAPITIRKIEADALRPSVQIAEHLALALNLPEEEHLAFIRLARAEREPASLSTPPPILAEIGQENLTGRAIHGFELGERIGAGGYGVVYRAMQTAVGREVAIKIILPQYADRPEFIRRFETEAQLVARLEHPHIVPLYDYWREPGVAYLVMRMLRGGSLESLLQTGPLAHPALLRVMEQICAGLYIAHRAGVIHRDLKPANILLDEDSNAYLADFGIAKQIGNGHKIEATLEGTVIGSPAYISPEQILAEPVKPQTDIYSLGIILFELVTGKRPFKGPTPFAYIQQHLNEPLPLLAQVQTDEGSTHVAEQPPTPAITSRPRLLSSTGQPIPTALDIVIGRATAKEARDRYPDILSLLADLRQALTPGATAADLAARQVQSQEAPHVATMIELPNLENPYKGLRPFSEADATDFFGRETLVQDLLARLAETNDPSGLSALAGTEQDLVRFLAVVGPSGSGKSSVVRAGLIPALRQGGLPGSESWFITEMVPSRHPFEELEAALLRIAINPPESLLTQLQDSERGLLRAVQRVLPADKDIELVLVIDQFEELFTLVEMEETRLHFLNNLVTAVLDPDSRLRLVITLRADFTDQPLNYIDFGELVRQRTEFVLPLTPDELEQAIVRPTEQAGLSLETGLVQTIIREIGDQPGMLPLLQYALTELFERRQGRLLTLAAYQESGGVMGALARRADEIYAGLDPSGQEMTRQLFLRLVTLGEGTEDTRRRVLRSELETLTADAGPSLTLPPPGEEDSSWPSLSEIRQRGRGQDAVVAGQSVAVIGQIIDLFGRYRLLTFDRDPTTRSPTIEVAHEALLREWQQLRQWVDDSRTDVQLQRRLALAAAEWLQADSDTSFLLRGARLDLFESWGANTNLALTQAEWAYLEASLTARQARQIEEETRQQRELETAQRLAETESRRAREQARANWRLRWLAVGLAVFLLAAISAAWFALTERNTAQNNFVTAERIRLASQAQIALDNGEGGDLPALLALRSLQYSYSPEADAALLSALQRGFARQRYLGHTDVIRRLELSPDGRYILTTGDDRTVRLWETQTGREVRQFMGHTAAVNGLSFSPDGRSILTSSLDNIACLWDIATGQQIRQFEGHGDVLSFTPDGQQVLSVVGMIAQLWDVQTGAEVRHFAGHTDAVLVADLSPDGHYLATFSQDKTARLWDVQTGEELRQFVGHTDWVGGGQLSADGRYLLTTSGDRTARLWDTQTGQEIRRFVGHTDALYDGHFSPDGRYVLTTSYDKTARLWDIASGREVRQFLGHTDYVGPATFSADGRYTLTGSGDRTARLWEVSPEIEPRTLALFAGGHIDTLAAINISPDNQLLLSGRTNGMVQLWDAETGQIRLQIKLSAAPNNTQVVSADNNLILAGDNEGIARLADAQTGQVVRQFVGHTGPIWDVAFSADNNYILTGGDDKTARLWDTQTGQELHQLAGHTGPIRAVAFSGDGRYRLTGSEDNTARLWDAQGGQDIQQLAGHTGAILDVAFSSDGRYILTGSEDNTARLWDAESGQEVHSFTGHTAPVRRVAFSPDGRYILTGSADQTARLWDVGSGQVVRQFAGHTSPLQFVAFSADGRNIITSDDRTAFLWRTKLEDAIAFACSHLSRDFNSAERVLYHINDTTPTCVELAEQKVEIEPTWTPVPPGTVKEAPLVFSVEMEFMNESANISMKVPIQDVFIDDGNGQVIRPGVLNEETLALPIYRSAVEVLPDFFEAPWDSGPYPKGEPLGFTLRDYVAVTGRGSYTVQGDRAAVELTFDHLVPHGLYTLWCNTLSSTRMTEAPCLASDGSVYDFTADKNGHGEISMDLKAFPPSTREAIYEIAVAYHSDGKTHGYSMGEHGRNSHGLLFYDFMPPEDTQAETANPSQVAGDESAVAREWMQLLVERVQTDFLPPTLAARIYGYAGITLYEAVVPSLPDYESLQGQLNDMPALPQPEDAPYNWPAVAASAAATVATALFESPTSQAAFAELSQQQLAALEHSGLAPDILDRSTAHGQKVGQAIVKWIETDGYFELRKNPYTPPTGPGYWIPTTPSKTKPTTPYWGNLRPFTLTAADTCKPPAPATYSEEPDSAFYAQAREVYDTAQTLTAEQKAIALFWADAPGMTGTPSGHWVSIVNQISEEQKLPLNKTVELHALVGIGLADAFISCWKEKYTVSLIRPESFIQQHIDPNWEPLMPSPPFPEYTSGHSTVSAAAAEILTTLLGARSFTDTTHENRGLGVRTFTSFSAAANEAAISRLYGGIHYRMAVENGLTQGQCIGQAVLDRVQTH